MEFQERLDQGGEFLDRISGVIEETVGDIELARILASDVGPDTKPSVSEKQALERVYLSVKELSSDPIALEWINKQKNRISRIYGQNLKEEYLKSIFSASIRLAAIQGLRSKRFSISNRDEANEFVKAYSLKFFEIFHLCAMLGIDQTDSISILSCAYGYSARQILGLFQNYSKYPRQMVISALEMLGNGQKSHIEKIIAAVEKYKVNHPTLSNISDEILYLVSIDNFDNLEVAMRDYQKRLKLLTDKCVGICDEQILSELKYLAIYKNMLMALEYIESLKKGGEYRTVDDHMRKSVLSGDGFFLTDRQIDPVEALNMDLIDKVTLDTIVDLLINGGVLYSSGRVTNEKFDLLFEQPEHIQKNGYIILSFDHDRGRILQIDKGYIKKCRSESHDPFNFLTEDALKFFRTFIFSRWDRRTQLVPADLIIRKAIRIAQSKISEKKI